MQSEYQGELFKEFEKKEGSLKRLTKKILPKRKPHILQIPLENIISFAILVILGFIISFALGVEKGKRHAQVLHKDEKLIILEAEKVAPMPALEEKEIIKEAPEVIAEEGKPYTIQLISYKDKKLAQIKVKELETMDIKADVIQRNKWFQVCVGSYVDKKDAESDLKRFSKEYKGSFLRNKEE
ncbi:MAG: SPOR domain-containing protein [Candidatus Omnitrophica bacterium]|nr:SPOR domain-containing protein [Candidatus Omnitrophota bacterium]